MRLRWLDTGLTISVGVAALTGADAAASVLLASADDALYRAKREGRNRVCVAGGEGEPPGGREGAA